MSGVLAIVEVFCKSGVGRKIAIVRDTTIPFIACVKIVKKKKKENQ